MSGSVLLHRQRSPEDLQLLLVWYKIRDTLLGQNCVAQDIKKALELASVCDHPSAVSLTKLFAGLNVGTKEEARQVFLGCENDPTALCFAALLETLVMRFLELLRLAMRLPKEMAYRFQNEEGFRWTLKSAAQGERDGFFSLW
jgi:hypothetical protein